MNVCMYVCMCACVYERANPLKHKTYSMSCDF